LTFHIGERKTDLANAPAGGGRYPCVASLLGRTYAEFHIDVGFGDAVVGEPERLIGDDLLGYAGLAPAVALAITEAQQFAEKIHAYTFPWSGRLNTRTKDLVDLVLLIERGSIRVEDLHTALAATFSTRGTHLLPELLPPPPKSWAIDFPEMATEAGLSTNDYLTAFGLLESFWNRYSLGGS
jgi:hypothetical protein